MFCQVCGKTESTLRITRIVDGVAEDFAVCEACASKVSPYHAKLMKKKEQLSTENVLKELLTKATELTQDPATGIIQATVRIPVCATCGLDFIRYKKTFMLGCPDCYTAFEAQLTNDIRRIHGATEHVQNRREAAREAEVVTLQSKLRSLRGELDQAVENEEFERAAAIRDEIKNVQARLGADHSEAEE